MTKKVCYIHGISDQRSLRPFYRFVLLPVVPFPPGDVPLPHTAVWRRAHGDRWQQSGGDAHGDSDRQHVQTGHLGDAVVFHEDWGGGGILVRHHCECWKTQSWTAAVFGFNSIPFSFGALLWSAVRRCQQEELECRLCKGSKCKRKWALFNTGSKGYLTQKHAQS